MAEVAIVGGGVIGCAIAYYLTEAGAHVTLLERGEIGGEASGAAAGMVGPPLDAAPSGPFDSAQGRPFRDLCRAGSALFPSLVPALAEETGIDIQYQAAGFLQVAETEERARALKAVAGHGRGLRLEWIEGEPLRRLEPALSPALLGAAYSPEQRHVNPGLLTQAFARAAFGRGAILRQGTAVGAFLRHGDRVIGIRTGDADAVGAGQIVLAAGPWTRPLARKLGVDVPTRPMRGQMIAYRSTLVRHIVSGEEGYLIPKLGGFLYAGATVEDVGFRPHITKRGLAWLRGMAHGLAPGLRSAEVASAWAGLRPGSPDGLPIIGPLPGWENVYVASGHFRNGILLAPITGRLIAQLVTEGKTELPLAPFSAERFGWPNS
jgi:glycine oxidase